MQPKYTPTRNTNQNYIDLTGQRFGRWTVLGRDEQRNDPHKRYWLCECDCGNRNSVSTGNLKSGRSRSCGCLKTEVQHKHGMTKTPVYQCWKNMRSRCNNPNNPQYFRYGGRGIAVCDRWNESFEAFYADMGEPPTQDHSLDRIDNNGPYSPENCRWATVSVQNRNKRDTVMLTINGKTLSLTDYAETVGLDRRTLYARIRRGASIQDAVFTTVKKGAKE